MNEMMRTVITSGTGKGFGVNNFTPLQKQEQQVIIKINGLLEAPLIMWLQFGMDMINQ